MIRLLARVRMSVLLGVRVCSSEHTRGFGSGKGSVVPIKLQLGQPHAITVRHACWLPCEIVAIHDAVWAWCDRGGAARCIS